MNWVLFPLFHRSGSFFPSGPSALMHSYSLAALPASVHTIRVCVCVCERQSGMAGVRAGQGGWRVIRDQRGHGVPAVACVFVFVCTPQLSNVETAHRRLTRSDNTETWPTSASKAPFHLPLFIFWAFVGKKEKQPEYTKGHHWNHVSVSYSRAQP